MRDKRDAAQRRAPFSLIVLGCLLSVAPTPQPQAAAEAQAAVSCVIEAWNMYDADGARRCYDESAVTVAGGERHAIDWEFERRLRAFDAAAHSRFRVEILDTRHPNVEFILYETNLLLEAFGLERVTARWRYTIRGGRVAEEQLLEADSRFRATLQEFTRWGRERRPAGWTSVTDRGGNVRFDGDTAAALIALAGEWSRSQSVPAELSALAAKAKLGGSVAAWCRGAFRPGHPGAFAVAVTTAAGGGRYLVLELDGSVKELGVFARRPDLSCYSRAEAAQLDVSIRRSDTIRGQITPRWDAAVICGFVDDTTAACWQYSPDDDVFVKVGGWTT